MSKILTSSSGQGPETYLPPSLHYIPPRTTNENSIEEAKMVIFPILDDLLLKCKISPGDIDILIVNCSGFCPSPSLSSLIVNKFKLKHNVKTFNLSGMGCTASMIAVGLAHKLLNVYKESNVVVLSTQILTTGWYQGNELPKLIINCHFRMGGAAILLSNRKQAQKMSKYRLIWNARAQWAFDDTAYNSLYLEEDVIGLTGVSVKKDFFNLVPGMIRTLSTELGSTMLPPLEKLKCVISIITTKYVNKSKEIYVPNFKTIIQHFCLPVAGVRDIGKGLGLGEKDIEPAVATMHRFGHQSASSCWYELAYLEAKERLKQGDNIWMLGMGTGLKCLSVVLECTRPIIGESNRGPWKDCINKYPIPAASE